ncbi:Fanconi-associated nuclease 1-like protein [Lasiodiplodia hormozganensis]|uniref:Fanconi-associated nuclease n=1 Tax=Lasiodiplodia hormozganensis TaxID=869390 RepID=A0AA39YYI7_9PEZI|nr:Fanconi-associated nuclease 1-like protein [Lasiodiplodia hormozganensis]
MVLQQRSPSKHNQMLGKKQTTLIPHPKSTNYDDDAPARPLKRIKRKEDDDNSEYARSPGSPKSAARARRVVPDSDAESNDEDADAPDPAARTDLESALPPVETDKEAIEAYEIQRAAEEAERLGQDDRLKEGKWVKGRSSIYVDAFNLALDTVLEEERHLFDEAEIEVFSQWRALDYEAQYLYVRLFLRKTSAWHRINNLGYHSDIADIDAAIETLQQERLLPDSEAPAQSNPGELEPPEGTALGPSFTFADRSENHIDTLGEASSLLKLDELKALAKYAKVQGKNKQELLRSFRRASQKQTGLGWVGLKRSDTEASTKSTDGDPNSPSTRENTPLPEDANRDAHWKRVTKLEKALKIAKRFQHSFGHVRLAAPVEVTIEGIKLEREPTPSTNNRGNSSPFPTTRRGIQRTIWLDEREGDGECTVEAMCLSHYRSQGWKGYHSEGGIVRTLFAYLFYDILFTYVPNVFQTPFQTCPLDLHTDAFYPTRLSEINHRLVQIANGEAARLMREVWDAHAERKTCIIGLDWTFEIEDMMEIAGCFEGEALATVCRVMAQEYGQRGGGVPDLFLWRPDMGRVMFAEFPLAIMADASDSNSNALIAEAATSTVDEVLSSPAVGIASPSHNPNNGSTMHPPTTSASAPTNSNDGHRSSHPQLTGTNDQTQPILGVEAKSPAAAAAAAAATTPNRPPKSRLDLCLETMDFTSMLAQHKATVGAVRDAVGSIEAAAARIEHRVKASSAAAQSNGSARMMKTKDRRIVWLMMKVILRKDAEILIFAGTAGLTRPKDFLLFFSTPTLCDEQMTNACFYRFPMLQKKIESELQRTQHSMWKLSREMRLISMKHSEGEDIEHEMYEMLEGFVMALTSSRGEDRTKWGEDGVELGEILDEIKADMEWWDDGKDD